MIFLVRSRLDLERCGPAQTAGLWPEQRVVSLHPRQSRAPGSSMCAILSQSPGSLLGGGVMHSRDRPDITPYLHGQMALT